MISGGESGDRCCFVSIPDARGWTSQLVTYVMVLFEESLRLFCSLNSIVDLFCRRPSSTASILKHGLKLC